MLSVICFKLQHIFAPNSSVNCGRLRERECLDLVNGFHTVPLATCVDVVKVARFANKSKAARKMLVGFGQCNQSQD